MLTISGIEILVQRELAPWDAGYDIEAIARELEDTYHLTGADPDMRFGQIPEDELWDVIRTYNRMGS